MRIVVTGASGNLGTGLLRRLRALLPDATVEGVCRRPPAPHAPYDRTRWTSLDLAGPDPRERLCRLFAGADAVAHLAWAIAPVRNEPVMRKTNIDGTRAVFDAVAETGVPHLVVASSLGAYAPGKHDAVDETWPVTGQPTSNYSAHKVLVENMLDEFARRHSNITVARIRPTVIAQRAAAAHLASLYFGPLIRPGLFRLLRAGIIPVLPLPANLSVQLVHADDVGDALVSILVRRAQGTFNLAANILGPRQLAAALGGARPLAVPDKAPRALLRWAFALHAVAVSPGWYDVATRSPMMNSDRARTELNWRPSYRSEHALAELISGWADAAPGISPILRE